MKNVLIDSCFWFALLGTRHDEYKPAAELIFERLERLECIIIVPFPSLYETVNTKLLKDKHKHAADWFLNQLNTNPRYIKVIDDHYREAAFIATTANRKRGISLVDNILRVMLSDATLKIDTLITFNSEDFSDACTRYGIELINEHTKF